MGLGDLFTAVIGTITLPISIVEEVLGEEGAIENNIEVITESLNDIFD